LFNCLIVNFNFKFRVIFFRSDGPDGIAKLIKNHDTINSIFFFYSFIGILGTWRENFCLLLAFCILLGLMVFVELALAVSFFSLATSGQLGIVVGQTMLKSLEHFSQTGYDGVTKGNENPYKKILI
jgi:hypothetical protein